MFLSRKEITSVTGIAKYPMSKAKNMSKDKKHGMSDFYNRRSLQDEDIDNRFISFRSSSDCTGGT